MCVAEVTTTKEIIMNVSVTDIALNVVKVKCAVLYSFIA